MPPCVSVSGSVCVGWQSQIAQADDEEKEDEEEEEEAKPRREEADEEEVVCESPKGPNGVGTNGDTKMRNFWRNFCNGGRFASTPCP